MSPRAFPSLTLATLATLAAACGDSGSTTAATTSTTGSGPTTVPQTDTGAPTTDAQPTTSATTSTSSASATGDSSTTDDPANPTAPPMTSTGDTGTTTNPMTTGPSECEEGSEQCKRGAHQICQQGVFVDAPCDPGQFCDEQSESCQDCACEPGATGTCVDDDNINVCNADCGGYTPAPCPGGQICVDDACVPLLCNPNAKTCADADSYQLCNDKGTVLGPATDCAADQVCEAGECISACEQAKQTKSNLGCEFWGVDLTNLPPRDKYVFAFAISNPSFDTPAKVQIFDRNNNNAEQAIITDMIPPRQVKVLNVSGANQGKMGYYPGDAGFLGSGIGLGRAFRIASDNPVVAVQFNPIGGALGYTTDASLLLPSHVLALDYIHLAWNNGFGDGSTLAVVATADNTTVTVTPKVNTPAGKNGLPAMQAGVPKDIVLQRYDYIQVTPGNADMTGSVIKSSAPVAVFGGHSCANVPTTQTVACDHVEEQIFPLETWGMNYIASRNPKRNQEPMLWRIIASEDNTKVDFDPPTSIGATVNLNKGQMVEFQDQNDFSIAADDPILVAGYMLGCGATGLPSNPGDPYMLLMIPNEQFQSEYVFLVDSSYEKDFAKFVRPAGAKVDLACFGVIPDNRWTKIGNSGFEWAAITMNPGEAQCKTGTNEVTGDQPFGISVSGQSSAASYAYPGGLALKPINPQ
jgi:hypothetical protein